jgi:hypothetical protein
MARKDIAKAKEQIANYYNYLRRLEDVVLHKVIPVGALQKDVPPVP